MYDTKLSSGLSIFFGVLLLLIFSDLLLKVLGILAGIFLIIRGVSMRGNGDNSVGDGVTFIYRKFQDRFN